MITRFAGLTLLTLVLFAPCSSRAELVPAGTILIVRTLDTISSTLPFTARLASSVPANLLPLLSLVAPAGTKVYGQINSSQSAGRALGKSTLSISLTDISSKQQKST